jgi:hypothetical protein
MVYSTILFPGDTKPKEQMTIVESTGPADSLDALSTKSVRFPQDPEGVGPLQVSTSGMSFVWTVHSLGTEMSHSALSAESLRVLDRDCSSWLQAGVTATSVRGRG